MFLAKTCTNPHQFTKSAPVCIVSPCKISAPRLLLKPAPEPNWKIWKYRGLLKAFFRGEVRCHPLWSMSLPIQSWAYGPCIKAQHQRDLHSAVLPVICLVPSASLPIRTSGGARNHWNSRLVAFAMASLHGQPPAIPTPDPFGENPKVASMSTETQHVVVSSPFRNPPWDPIKRPLNIIRFSGFKSKWTNLSGVWGAHLKTQSWGKWRSAAKFGAMCFKPTQIGESGWADFAP